MAIYRLIAPVLLTAVATVGSTNLAVAQQFSPEYVGPQTESNPYLRQPDQPGVPPQSGLVPVQYQQPGQAPQVAAIPQVRQPSIADQLQPQPGEHPLAAAVRWSKAQVPVVRSIRDYKCKMVKREAIDGKVGEYEYMTVKVRHQPFSVYLRFDGPARVQGQEAMYVQGQNDNKLLAHANGMRHKLFGTVALTPTGSLAMAGNRYPITEIGVLNLTERLIAVAEKDMQYGECEVKIIEGAKINGRDCVCVQVMHPVPRREFTFYLGRIYIDTELQLPVRYEAYDWPTAPGANPQVQEEYTYLDIVLNNGFTDMDFSTKNPEYQFE